MLGKGELELLIKAAGAPLYRLGARGLPNDAFTFDPKLRSEKSTRSRDY